MDYGTCHRDIRNDCNFYIHYYAKIVATGIKSNGCRGDAGDECLGGYDARLLTKFWPKPTKALMSAAAFRNGTLLPSYKQHRLTMRRARYGTRLNRNIAVLNSTIPHSERYRTVQQEFQHGLFTLIITRVISSSVFRPSMN
jgi:hypothetical protein